MLSSVRIAFNIFIQSYYSTALIWFYFNCVFSYIKIYIFKRNFWLYYFYAFWAQAWFFKTASNQQATFTHKKDTWLAAGTEKVF